MDAFKIKLNFISILAIYIYIYTHTHTRTSLLFKKNYNWVFDGLFILYFSYFAQRQFS